MREGDCGMLCLRSYRKAGKVGIMVSTWARGPCCGCWNWAEFERTTGFVPKAWFFDTAGGGNRRFFRANSLSNCVCGSWIKPPGKSFLEKEFFPFGAILGRDSCVTSAWDGVLEGEANTRPALSSWAVDLSTLAEFEAGLVEAWTFFISWVVNDAWLPPCAGLSEILVWSKGCELSWVIEGEFPRRFPEPLLISWFWSFPVGAFLCSSCVKV